jgi:hypothetical protein
MPRNYQGGQKIHHTESFFLELKSCPIQMGGSNLNAAGIRKSIAGYRYEFIRKVRKIRTDNEFFDSRKLLNPATIGLIYG